MKIEMDKFYKVAASIALVAIAMCAFYLPPPNNGAQIYMHACGVISLLCGIGGLASIVGLEL